MATFDDKADTQYQQDVQRIEEEWTPESWCPGLATGQNRSVTGTGKWRSLTIEVTIPVTLSVQRLLVNDYGQTSMENIANSVKRRICGAIVQELWSHHPEISSAAKRYKSCIAELERMTWWDEWHGELHLTSYYDREEAEKLVAELGQIEVSLFGEKISDRDFGYLFK